MNKNFVVRFWWFSYSISTVHLNFILHSPYMSFALWSLTSPIHSQSLSLPQVLSDDDPLGEILKDIPEPTEEMVKSEHTTLTLDLIQGSRDSIGLWPEVDLGAVSVVLTQSSHEPRNCSKARYWPLFRDIATVGRDLEAVASIASLIVQKVIKLKWFSSWLAELSPS